MVDGTYVKLYEERGREVADAIDALVGTYRAPGGMYVARERCGGVRVSLLLPVVPTGFEPVSPP
jgi:hypothetical protein